MLARALRGAWAANGTGRTLLPPLGPPHAFVSQNRSAIAPFSTPSSAASQSDQSSAALSTSATGFRQEGEGCRHYDVVIVGGGIVGSALGCALKSGTLTSQLRIAIIDRQPSALHPSSSSSTTSSNGGGGDGKVSIPGLRVSSITPSTCEFLKKVNIWDRLAPPRSRVFHAMQVWDTSGSACMRFSGEEDGQVEMGHVVENDLLKSCLEKEAANLGCEFTFGSVSDILLPQPEVGITKTPRTMPEDPDEKGEEFTDGEVRIHLEGEGGIETITTSLVVGADGANSFVSKKGNFRFSTNDYGQRAVTATVSVAQPDVAVAFQRFLPTGPIALLPVRDGFSNIVWSTSIQDANELEKMSPTAFASAANDALQSPGEGRSSSTTGQGFEMPPEVTSVVGGRQRSFRLAMRHALSYTRKGVALVGDAAHSIHPLAGQGVNLGFGDVVVLQKVLEEALWSGQDYSDMLTLDKYSAKRRLANGAMIGGLDAVKLLFQPQSGPVAAMRDLGMSLINNAQPLKRLIVSYASSNARAT